jgi:thioester reductase-like protein
VAEQLVFGAGKQGLKVGVYRPSFITASAQKVASSDDIVIRLLAFMINEGIAVNARNQVSFLPAEVVADNIVAIFKQPATSARTFHITADEYYNLADITRLITHEYGYEFVYYDIPAFVAELKRRCTPNDLLYPLLDFFNRSQEKIAAMQRKRYNNVNYRAARGAIGDPPLIDVVAHVVSYMLREGLIRSSRRAEPGEIEAGVNQHKEHDVQQRSTPRVGRLDARSRSIRS